MSLNNKDLNEIEKLFENLQSDDDYKEILVKSTEINTKVLTQLSHISDQLEEISGQFNNGITDLVDENNEKIDQIYKDVSSKDGYLPKIKNKLTYF